IYRRTNASLTTVTARDVGVSCSSKERPCKTLVPIVSKYRGETRFNIAPSSSFSFGVKPSTAIEKLQQQPLNGLYRDMLGLDTPGIAFKRENIRSYRGASRSYLYPATTGSTSTTRTLAGSNPNLWPERLPRLLVNEPAPARTTTARATCATITVFPNPNFRGERVEPLMPVLAPLIVMATLELTRIAGNTPKISAESDETTRVNTSTRTSGSV